MSDESRPVEPWVGTAAGRGPNGLFAKGNSIASGNPQAKHFADLRKAAREAATPAQVKAVMNRFLNMFWRNDDLQAGIVWMQYAVGKPAQTVEINDEGEGGGTTVITLVRTQAGVSSASDD